jgi:hypothetical protein
MSKDTFYFSHDYNVRTDYKIKRLVAKHGMTGYGVFWAIIEELYNNANALRTDYDVIAYELRVEENTVKSIINDFDLFVFDGDTFGSMSVERRLEARDKISKINSDNARKRWDKQKNNQLEKDATAMRPQCDGDAKGKERKGKENKEQIEYIYSLYPSKCFVKNCSTGKSSKDKEKISKLLKEYSVEELAEAIKLYLDDSKDANRYLQNFKTFLNNIPDVKELKQVQEQTFFQKLFDDGYGRELSPGGKFEKLKQLRKSITDPEKLKQVEVMMIKFGSLVSDYDIKEEVDKLKIKYNERETVK